MKDLVQHNLNNQVTARPEALDLTLSQLKNTIAVLEPLVKKMKGKPKPKGSMLSGTKRTVLPLNTETRSECIPLIAS